MQSTESFVFSFSSTRPSPFPSMAGPVRCINQVRIIFFWFIACSHFLFPSLIHVTLYIFKVHLTPNTISAKMSNWTVPKETLTFFRSFWIFCKQQNYLKFDTVFVTTEVVRGMGLFLVWGHKLFCMHVHKELMGCKWVYDINCGIDPVLSLAWSWHKWQQISATFR